MIADYSDAAYDIVLVLHIVCAIVGFGAVILNGIYGQQVMAHPGPEGLAIFQANKLVSKIGEYFIYAVFVLGVVLVLLSGDVLDFGQTWVWLSMAIFLVSIGISHGLLYPRVNQMETRMIEMGTSGAPLQGSGPPPQVAQLAQLGKQVGVISTLLHIAMVAIIVMMVTKPGLG